VAPTFGIHPWEAPKHQRHLDSFRPLIDETPIIGEIGLDHRFVKDSELWPAQRKVFEFFLEAACEQKKIVNVHSSGAESEVLEALDEHDIERAIIHWYNGPEETFRRLVARGYHFTFGVELRTNAHIQALAKECPAELILTETDNPGGAKWLFGEQGMPRLLGGVVQHLAKARQTTPHAIVELVQANFLRLIAQDEPLASVRAKFA
jgi:TatD DNase family protein